MAGCYATSRLASGVAAIRCLPGQSTQHQDAALPNDNVGAIRDLLFVARCATIQREPTSPAGVFVNYRANASDRWTRAGCRMI